MAAEQGKEGWFIYGFVARGTVVLAEYTEYTGNFPAIAAQCLQKLPSSDKVSTYACDGHAFIFLVHSGYGNSLISYPCTLLLVFCLIQKGAVACWYFDVVLDLQGLRLVSELRCHWIVSARLRKVELLVVGL